jgi:hypothetical protein
MDGIADGVLQPMYQLAAHGERVLRGNRTPQRCQITTRGRRACRDSNTCQNR